MNGAETRLSRWMREPLVHFALLGAVLFAVYVWMDRGQSSKQEILVSAGQIQSLSATFERTWMRPPSAEELSGLVKDYVREEIAYREAQAMGLDRDDTVVRRHLRQKLEFISGEVAQAEPGDGVLAAYLAQHSDSFRTEERMTFTQVFLDPTRHGDALVRDAQRLLDELRRRGAQPGDVRYRGDASLLEERFADVTAREISGSFGAHFLEQMRSQPKGSWQGPLRSGYGVHLVYVEAWTPAGVPELAGVRDAVLREWQNERRLAALDEMYARLLTGYTVTIERPSPAERVAGAGR
jgi:hypothetical protein